MINREDILFLADLLCDYDPEEHHKEQFERLRGKLMLITEQVHLQDNIMQINEKLQNIEKEQKEQK